LASLANFIHNKFGLCKEEERRNRSL